jgi:hypothetical protein
VRDVVDDLVKRAGNDRILLVQDFPGLISPFQWQLGKHGAQVVQRRDIDWAHLNGEDSLWVFSYGWPAPEEVEEWQSLLARSGRRWRCVENRPLIVVQRRADEPFLHCRVYHWVRERETCAVTARR